MRQIDGESYQIWIESVQPSCSETKLARLHPQWGQFLHQNGEGRTYLTFQQLLTDWASRHIATISRVDRERSWKEKYCILRAAVVWGKRLGVRGQNDFQAIGRPQEIKALVTTKFCRIVAPVLALRSHCQCSSFEFYSVEDLARESGRWWKRASGGAYILRCTTFPQLGSFLYPLEVKFLWLESAAWCFKEDVVSTLQSGWARGREQSGTGICSGSLMRILMGLCAGKRERETHIHHVVRAILSRPKLRVERI